MGGGGRGTTLSEETERETEGDLLYSKIGCSKKEMRIESVSESERREKEEKEEKEEGREGMNVHTLICHSRFNIDKGLHRNPILREKLPSSIAKKH